MSEVAPHPVQAEAVRRSREHLALLTTLQTTIDVPDVELFPGMIDAAAALFKASLPYTALGRTPGRYLMQLLPVVETPDGRAGSQRG